MHALRYLLASIIVIFASAVFLGLSGGDSKPRQRLQPVKGGEFLMGDVFEEGRPIEKPPHVVRVADFSLGAHEVTVAEFRRFVEETGYTTSAEQNPDPDEHRRLLAAVQDNGLSPVERQRAYREMLQHAGCFCFDPEQRTWELGDDRSNWKVHRFAQSESHPVTCVSWNDAIHYCNWLSRLEGLPVAYKAATGEMVDEAGNPTLDTTRIRGYRLPTEAEWEFAARERGRRVRFGNGSDTARSSEINFDATHGDYPFLEQGELRARTTEVGAFAPNSLGLFDMSGNVWEWCSDWFQPYSAEAAENPYGFAGDRRVARGGRWGGDAFELRATARFAWEPDNRCNNIGFRVARSAFE